MQIMTSEGILETGVDSFQMPLLNLAEDTVGKNMKTVFLGK